jgi:hypothetical protein
MGGTMVVVIGDFDPSVFGCCGSGKGFGIVTQRLPPARRKVSKRKDFGSLIEVGYYADADAV